MESHKIDFEKLNINSVVYSLQHGRGVVVSKGGIPLSGAIEVEYDDDGIYSYYYDGRYYESDLIPEIYTKPVKVVVDNNYNRFRSLFDSLEVDDKLHILLTSGECFNAHFACMKNDFRTLLVWSGGQTSFTTDIKLSLEYPIIKEITKVD